MDKGRHITDRIADAEKTASENQGELKIAVGRDEKGNVVVDFGTQVLWLAMEPKDATNFALTMLGHAGARIQISVDDAMVERAQQFMNNPLRPPDGEPSAEWIRALLQFAINAQEV